MDITRPRVCKSCGYNFWSNDVVLLIRGCLNCYSNEVTPGVVILQQTESVEMTDINAVLVERGSRYGKFKDHALLSQRLKQVMATGASYGKLKPDQVEALEMIAHKIARILNGDPNYDDSWRDVIGYAQLVLDNLNGVER